MPQFRRQGRGRIINVTSYTGLHGNPGQSNYAMAKAGIIGFTKSTAKELARFGITVNAISPNARTRMIDSVPPDKLEELTAAIPMGRFAEASEMAAAVAFLASDEACLHHRCRVPGRRWALAVNTPGHRTDTEQQTSGLRPGEEQT